MFLLSPSLSHCMCTCIFFQTRLATTPSNVKLVSWESEGLTFPPGISYTLTCMQICHQNLGIVLHLLFSFENMHATE